MGEVRRTPAETGVAAEGCGGGGGRVGEPGTGIIYIYIYIYIFFFLLLYVLLILYLLNVDLEEVASGFPVHRAFVISLRGLQDRLRGCPHHAVSNYREFRSRCECEQFLLVQTVQASQQHSCLVVLPPRLYADAARHTALLTHGRTARISTQGLCKLLGHINSR